METFVKTKARYLAGFYLHAKPFEAYILGRFKELQKKQRWWRPLTQELAYAQAFGSLVTELRYCLQALAKAPVYATTGEMQLKLQPRLYSDMTNQIASELVAMPNYTCRARFVSTGEHVLKTKPLPPPVSEGELARRLAQIRRQMFEQGLTHYAKDVEKEIAERHQKLRGSGEPDEPPPTSF